MKQFFHIIFSILFIYTSSSDPQCFDKNCLTCTDSLYGSCTSCKSDFKLFYGSCVCYDPNCLSCKTSLFGACTQCKPNFILYFGQCFCNIQYCMVCSETGCSQCQSGYKLNGDKTQCIEDPSSLVRCSDLNCDTCLSEQPGTCVYCKDGYYDEKGICVASPECSEKDESGKCTKCPSGYYLDEDGYCYPRCNGQPCNDRLLFDYYGCESECFVCQGNQLYEYTNCSPKNNYCTDPHCTQCRQQGTGFCDRCEVGYSRKNGECYQCKAPNCLKCEYTDDENKCSICMNNYDLVDGICQLNSTSVVTYPSNKRETSTPTPLPPEETETPAEGEGSIKCNVQNCDICSTRNYCASCKSGYELKKGACIVPCNVENCDHCDTQNICASCLSEYNLQSDNTCKLSCKEANCVSCITSKWCIECAEGYQVSGVGCTPICDDPNCSYCSTASNCVSCSSGYTVVEGVCKPCDDKNCQLCTNTEANMCTGCKYGFMLVDGICAERCESISKCEYCISNQSKCVSCKNGCTLKDGKCSCFNSFLVILLVIIGVVVIGFGIFCYIGFTRKKEQQNAANRMEQGINMVPIIGTAWMGHVEEMSSEKMMEKYEGEFISNKIQYDEKETGMCQYCNCRPARYISDCGCKLCKEHSKPVKDENEVDNNKKCPHCAKIVYKVQLIKMKCGICLEDKAKLAKFNCHCALMVCKDCYVKCKMTSKTCPACRKPIE